MCFVFLLLAHDGPIGTRAIGGVLSGDQVSISVSEVIQGLKPFETELVELVQAALVNSDGRRMQSRQAKRDGDRSRTLSVEVGE